MKQKIRKIFQIRKNKRIMILNEKEKYKYHDRDDLDYHG